MTIKMTEFGIGEGRMDDTREKLFHVHCTPFSRGLNVKDYEKLFQVAACRYIVN